MDDLREQYEVYIRVRNPDYYKVRISYVNFIIKIAQSKLLCYTKNNKNTQKLD